MRPAGDLVLSVVSHGQRKILTALLDDLHRNVTTPFRVVVTENIPEGEDFPTGRYPFHIDVIRNERPKGFGANHNAALARATGELFCVLNPDLRIPADPFPALAGLLADPGVGVAAPSVVGPDHLPEDHARAFPSVFTLAAKVFGYRPRVHAPEGLAVYHPDWVAGMFMLFRAETLHALGGFDERYFLYYEDVDLCARLRDRGLDVAVCASTFVIHDARRESRRNVRYAWWHMESAARFLVSRPGIALGLNRNRRN